MTHDQFVRHWVEVHAPLALAVPGLRRYVQSHIVDERTRPDIRHRGGCDEKVIVPPPSA